MNMSKNEIYDYLEEYYGETVATDMCNYWDSAQLTEYVEWLKEGNDS